MCEDVCIVTVTKLYKIKFSIINTNRNIILFHSSRCLALLHIKKCASELISKSRRNVRAALGILVLQIYCKIVMHD